MPQYKIVLTREAICDVVNIAEYIEDNFGKEKADEFENNMKHEMQDLGYMAEAYAQTQIVYRGYAIRKKIFSPSIIFYVVKADEKEVHILRVLREEQNWNDILIKWKKYTYP